MRAFVLCAGFGKRLGHWTQEVPKPMLDVCGRPLVEYTVRHLAGCGFRHITLNLHFRPEMIRNYFEDGARLGVQIEYSHEEELLGTAGGARKMADLAGLNEPVLIHYGDLLTNQDHALLAGLHRERRALATVLVHQRQGSNSIVDRDADGRVVRFVERPSEEERRAFTSASGGREPPGPGTWVNSGICLLEPEVLSWIAPHTASDLARDVFPRLVASGRFFSLPLTGYRCAIDSPERLELARQAVQSGDCRFAWQALATAPREAA